MSATGDRLNQRGTDGLLEVLRGLDSDVVDLAPHMTRRSWKKFAGVTRSLQLLIAVRIGVMICNFWPQARYIKDHWICVRRMRVGLLDGDVGPTRRLDNHILDLVAGVTFYPMSTRQLIGLG